MNRTLRNTVAVLVLTAFTAIGVVATVQATGRIAGTDTATAAARTTQAAVQSTDSGAYDQGYGQGYGQQSSGDQSSAQQSESTGPYGYPSSVYTPDANGLMYCPRTGCAASSCHALQ